MDTGLAGTAGMARLGATLAITLGLLLSRGVSGQTHPGLPEVLPEDFEIEAALSAGPRTIRDGAGVWRMMRDGYQRVRASTNGWECMAVRDPVPPADPARQNFTPMCFDEASARVVLQRFVVRSRLIRAEGRSREEADAWIEGHADEFDVQRPGMVYMASALNTQTDPMAPRGPFRNYMPHVMFLAPHTSDAQVNGGMIAADPGDAFFDGWPFLPGAPREDGFVVVPLDRRLRLRIYAEQAGLVEQLSAWLPRQAPVDRGAP